jgi:hypothetical protein
MRSPASHGHDVSAATGTQQRLAPTRREPDASASKQRSVVGRSGVVLLLGLGIGVATMVLQSSLNPPWASLADAASPWLAPAFAVGVLWRRMWVAAGAGLAVCLLEILGYYTTATARGYTASQHELWFWGLCAVLAGPVLGAAGWVWRRGPQRFRGLGAAVLASAWLAEAAVAYAWRLHYFAAAGLFAGIGLLTIGVLGFRHSQHRDILRWLIPTLALGMVIEVILDVTHRQVF